MAMEKCGLAKLTEECGELIQVAAKKMAYMDTDLHPDGRSMKDRLEEEIADVLAACTFVAKKLDLNEDYIEKRARDKIARFEEWDRADA